MFVLYYLLLFFKFQLISNLNHFLLYKKKKGFSTFFLIAIFFLFINLFFLSLFLFFFFLYIFFSKKSKEKKLFFFSFLSFFFLKENVCFKFMFLVFYCNIFLILNAFLQTFIFIKYKIKKNFN